MDHVDVIPKAVSSSLRALLTHRCRPMPRMSRKVWILGAAWRVEQNEGWTGLGSMTSGR